MHKNNGFFENYFFKKRIFFVADKNTSLPESILCNPYFRVEVIKCVDDLSLKADVNNLIKHDLMDKFVKRLENPSFTLYLALNKDNSEIAGYFWTAEANEEPIWHDKIYVEPNSVLGLDAFTLPEYRGKGAFPFLKSVAIKHTVLQTRSRSLYPIVESSNKASIRANEKLGLRIAGENYLIKLFGRNIFSIIHRNGKWEIHYVFRNAKSKTL